MGRRAGLLVLIVSAVAALPAAAAGQVLRVGSLPRDPGAVQLDPERRERRPARATGSWSGPVTTRPPAARARRQGRRSGRRADDHPARLPARHEPQHGDRRRHQARHAGVQLGRRRPELRAQRRRSGPLGLNGIVVWKADRRLGPEPDHVQLPRRHGRAGNEIWWNGGDDSGTVGRPGLPTAPTSTPPAPTSAGEGTAAASTGSSPATGAAAPGIRPTRRTSTTPATTSAPASRCATRRSTTPGPSTTRSATPARTPAAGW